MISITNKIDLTPNVEVDMKSHVDEYVYSKLVDEIFFYAYFDMVILQTCIKRNLRLLLTNPN